ncbi:hypothetical protein BVC80_1837g183 [Macleaya cordata]|uniref:U5 small nuclear ribonucleoprotein TSSC4 n=1 Tax=Macleaya cordata TaxID=56857 RepID=A0A200R3T8_MACCD|nr:hypothetical protein BVC80_1837g183 [Macleaya cordata]
MDDSFRVRVDKIFGALGPDSASSSSSSSLRSLWSLSDAEVEKREWNRERDSPDREDAPCSSSFNGFFANKHNNSNKKNSRNKFDDDIDDEDEDEDDEQQGRGSSNQSFDGEEHEKEEWEIRSSIGMDPTLDHEEEEDEFDKVAVGRENANERTYMKDITDYGPYLNAHNVLPSCFKDHVKDPRANLLSAINRLKEDKEVAGSFDSHQAADTMQAVVDPEVNLNQNAGNLKPILKRKENQSDSKSNKRVRFDPECKDNCDQEFENPSSVMATNSMETTTTAEDTSLFPQYTSGVPDYVRNPSKYTCYSFDSSSDLDEQSNRQACMDFLNTIRRSKSPESQSEGTFELPKSITFTPKKKASDGASVKRDTEMYQNQEDISKEAVRRAGILVGIAAIETIENEACAMEEDEQQTTTTDAIGSSRKPDAWYQGLPDTTIHKLQFKVMDQGYMPGLPHQDSLIAVCMLLLVGATFLLVFY